MQFRPPTPKSTSVPTVDISAPINSRGWSWSTRTPANRRQERLLQIWAFQPRWTLLVEFQHFSGALFDIRNSSEVFPIEIQSNPGVPQTITDHRRPSAIRGFATDKGVGSPAKAVDMDLRLQGLTRHTQTMVGDKLLTVATHYVQDRINNLGISVITIPHAASVGSIRDVSDDELYS